MKPRKRLLFVAPNFLLPADGGGKIRTTDILRGMKGKEFEIVLASPAPNDFIDFSPQLEEICDRFVHWPEKARGATHQLHRFSHLLSPLPASVAADISAAGRDTIASQLEADFDVVVIDFAHTSVLAPRQIPAASVMFTHNVETEIFQRHVRHARSPVTRAVWQDQARKMEGFERSVLSRFDAVVAVSERDAEYFREHYSLDSVHVIPTGVDLSRFSFKEPRRRDNSAPTIVFTGSMDWRPNIDAIEYFRDAIWPLIVDAVPDTRMIIVGRDPPQRLVSAAYDEGLPWTFTGYVEDTRAYIQAGDLSIIPLRIGGGTRLKAYEAVALGSPIVTTSIGIEGLPLVDNEHCLIADNPAEFAADVIRLLKDDELRKSVARSAYRFVADNFSSGRVADRFIEICEHAMQLRSMQHGSVSLKASPAGSVVAS